MSEIKRFRLNFGMLETVTPGRESSDDLIPAYTFDRLQQERDTLARRVSELRVEVQGHDCRYGEASGDSVHCRPGYPCTVCQVTALARRVAELEAIASELKCRGCGGLGTVGDYYQREIAPHIFAGEVVDRTCPDCGGTGRWRVPTEGQSAPPVRD